MARARQHRPHEAELVEDHLGRCVDGGPLRWRKRHAGVVSYEVFRGNVLLGSTTTNDFWIPEAGVLANDLTIVSVRCRWQHLDQSPNRPDRPARSDERRV
ncbi:MAG: hypothetical protein R2706_02855 [Acidimicrobiales bacterium]